MLERFRWFLDSPAVCTVFVVAVVWCWHRILVRRPALPSWLHSALLAVMFVDGMAHEVVWPHQPLGRAHRVVDVALWLCVLAVLLGNPRDWWRRGARRARAALTSVESGRLERETREAFT